MELVPFKVAIPIGIVCQIWHLWWHKQENDEQYLKAVEAFITRRPICIHKLYVHV
jgi:hypothetical protein